MAATYSDIFDSYAPVPTTWVPPTQCSSEAWDVTSMAFAAPAQLVTDSRQSILYNTPTTVSAIWNDPKDSLFTTCAPDVWTRWSGSFVFAPAVCPQDWTTVFAGTLSGSPTQNSLPVPTLAFCCSKDYTLNLFHNATPAAVCTSILTAPASGPESHGSGQVVTVTEGIRAHPAWFVGYDDADPGLMPRPTKVTSDFFSAAFSYINSHLVETRTPISATPGSSSTSNIPNASTTSGGWANLETQWRSSAIVTLAVFVGCWLLS
ncbi:hypothetical protein GQ53DRAFT_842296 [Thozetella sp. PMI_491]|nr:hypothetical protein GQ53DRAFT_842296 [Thozetella sp. PMI_491]